ncbi:MAG TPA: imidazolonepropionase [Phycisphaerales bacterium]|nr:imidazolonepropionase [Phycisphaerales bacterium]
MNTPTQSRYAPAIIALLASVLFLIGPATAQDLIPAAPPQRGGVILAGGTVHTVSGDTIENAALGFRDGTINMLAPASILKTISLTPDTEIIDITGKHVYPGIIAAITRLGLTETEAVRATHDYDETGDFTPEVRAVVAVNPDSTLIPVARLNGVLLAGVWPSGGRVPGRVGVIRLDGWTWQDMTVRDDAGLVLNWPAVRPRPDRWTGKPKPDAADRVIDRLDAINRFFDAAAAYAKAHAADPDAPRDLRLEAVAPYLEQTADHRLLIHANDYDQIVSAVTFASRRGLSAVIVGGRDAPLCADLLKANGIPVIVDGVYRFPKRADSPHDEAFALPARLHDAGVRFCIAGADRDGNVRNLPYEAAMAARFGLDRDEAIRAITLSAAEILGIADTFGSIEQGKSATLIVTTGDILEIPTNTTLAYIDGRRIDLRSKQTELRDKYTEKYRQLHLIDD